MTLLANGTWAAVLLIQVTLVSLLGMLAWRTARRGGPALRGTIVLATLMGLLFVPWIALATPVWLPLPSWVAAMDPKADDNEPSRDSPLPSTFARSASEPKTIAIFLTPKAGQRVGPELSPAKQQTGEGGVPVKAEAYVFNLTPQAEDAAAAVPASGGEDPSPRMAASWSLGGVLAAAWLLGAVAFFLHALGRLALLYRCAQQARPIRDAEWLDAAAALAARHGLRPVPLREHPALGSALTLGLFCPLIVLPRGRRRWSAEQRNLILAHELAHVRRRDFLAGLIAEFALCLCWFHPLVRWLAGRLRLEQEYAADAWVASALDDSRNYIRCLARLALELSQGRGSLAPAFWRRRPEILRRIEMLRHNPARIPPRLGKRAACLVAAFTAATCLAIAGVGPVQSAADEPKPADASGDIKAKPSVDALGDPLPSGALARLGTTRLRHGGEITFVAFGPGGKTLLTAGRDHTIRLWELATGKEIRRFIRPKPAEAKKKAKPRPKQEIQVDELVAVMGGGRPGSKSVPVAATADGKLLAAGQGDNIQLWEVETGKPLRHIEVSGPEVAGLLFSPDGHTLATRSTNGTLTLWETDTGTEIRQIKPPRRPNQTDLVLSIGDNEADAPGMAFTADGKTLVAAAFDYKDKETLNSLKLWDIASGNQTGQIKLAGNASVSALAVAPDGKLVACGANNSVHLCEADSGKEVRQLEAPDGIRSLNFSPDGKLLAVGGRNQRVRVFETASGKQLHQLGDAQAPRASGGLVIVGGGPSFGPETRAVAFSPDGQRLAAAAGSTFRLWEAATGKELPLLAGHRTPPTAIVLAPDGKTAVSWGADHIVRRWDAATGKPQGQFAAPAGTTRAAFSTDGQVVALANRDNTIRLHDTATGKELHKLKGHQGGVAALGFAPDGKVLASRGTSDHSVRLYDVATGTQLRQMTMRPASNPDGNLTFVFGGARRPRGPGLAFSPDGKLVVVPGPSGGNSSHTLVLFDVATGKVLRKIESSQAITSLAFAPDGRTLATECANRTILLWELASGKQRGKLGTPVAEQPQNGGGMMSIAVDLDGFDFGGGSTDPAGPVGLSFSPDGRALIARGADSAVRVWDVAAGKEIGSLKGHLGRIETVAFAANGRTLASAASDTTILLWDAAAPLMELAKPKLRELPTADLETLWRDLAGEDAVKAHRGVQKLSGAPRQTVPLLAERLNPAARINPKKIDGWITDLDSDKFAVRKEALANLLKTGEQAVPALRKMLASSPPLETRKRVEELLDRLTGGVLTTEQLRLVRAIEALERIATPDARQLLRTLSDGAPGALATREAQAALGRLK